MYHRQNSVNDKPYQTTDFFSLKSKSSQIIYTHENNKIVTDLNKEGPNIISILGFFYFLNNPEINQQIFSAFNFDLTPKIFQTFSHQKTLKFILKILITQQLSQPSLMQLINDYPIFNFVIQAYCRAFFIKEVKKQLNDSEKEIIQNFSFDFRGNILQMFVNCLNFHLTLICGPFTQTYGNDKNNKKVQIKFIDSKIQAEIISKKQNLAYSRQIQSSAAKTLKKIHSQQKQTEASESFPVSLVESCSFLKDTTEIVRCQKCKMVKSRCYCSRKQIGSPYHTPNNASRIEKNVINNTIQATIPSIALIGKCTCHKVFCTCKK